MLCCMPFNVEAMQWLSARTKSRKACRKCLTAVRGYPKLRYVQLSRRKTAAAGLTSLLNAVVAQTGSETTADRVASV